MVHGVLVFFERECAFRVVEGALDGHLRISDGEGVFLCLAAINWSESVAVFWSLFVGDILGHGIREKAGR